MKWLMAVPIRKDNAGVPEAKENNPEHGTAEMRVTPWYQCTDNKCNIYLRFDSQDVFVFATTTTTIR